MENADAKDMSDAAKPKLAIKPLKEHASKTVKVLWTGVGALATLGGVVGLVQVFSGSGSSQLPAGASSQDVLMEMVKSGDIDVADAERLAELLYGDDGQSNSEGLQDIAESGTDRQKKAIALMAERHTREEGLDILEAEAKTGADWRLIAELAYGFDPDRALSAVKKAIALDPSDFRAVTLMSQIQVQTGDYASAQRSAKTAELLATTTAEKVMAARSTLNILISASNVSDLPAAIEALETILETNAIDVETEPLPAQFSTSQDAELHPLYLQAMSKQALASAYLYTAQNDAALQATNEAMEALKPIIPRIKTEDRAKFRRRLAAFYDTPIFVEFARKNWDELMSLSQKQLNIYRDVAAAGDKAGQTQLASRYARHAGYAVYAGDHDAVRSASERSLELSQLASDRRPDDARLALNLVQVELNNAILLASIGDKVDLSSSFDKTMSSLEEALTGQPDEAKNSPWTRYSGLLSSAVSYFSREDFEFEENPSEEIMARAENFLDQEIASRPNAHDPRHARNFLYLTQGDYLSSQKDHEGARKAFLRAFDDSADITPTETEPDVVPLSQLVALQRLVALEEPGVEAADKPELQQAIELAEDLNRAGKLTTPYQPVYSFLIATRDGTIPDYEGID